LGAVDAHARLPLRVGMTRPLIAVVGRRSENVDVLRYSATLAAEAMCEAVWAGGGEPLVLHGPAGDPAAELTARLRRFDGILLPGGADLGPGRYGQVPVPEVVGVVDFQDDLDLAVAQTVVTEDLPTLAICRGMQVLNVALGGTLVQHLAPSSVHHVDPGGRGECLHEVSVDPGTRLRQVVGQDRIPVSSYHHQAVDRIGAGLRVVARADDGCVEALEHDSADVLAVQWHPEDTADRFPTDHALFADLAERASARRAERAGVLL
jgi:putative glutamine amidotransferase